MGRKHYFLGVGLALAVSALRAQAASGWAESGAAVDEVVADTTMVPAASPAEQLTPLLAKTPFDNFRYPHVDAAGTVTFIADDPGYGSKGVNHGIFRSAPDGTLRCLVRGGETTVPGTGLTLHDIRGLQMDGDGVNFVFNAFDSESQRGLYYWADGKVTLIARSGVTTLPGDRATINELKYGALEGTHVVYQATSPTVGNVLVLHDLKSGSDQVIFRGAANTKAAGTLPGANYLAEQNWITGDSILFRAGSAKNSSFLSVTGAPSIYGWLGIKDWSGTSGELAPAKLKTVVDGNTRVPRTDGSLAALQSICSAPTDGQVTAFVGYGKNFRGIYCTDLAGGGVRTIMDDASEVAGLFQGGAVSFGYWPTVIDRSVIFTVEAGEAKADAPAYGGVFLYRVDTDTLFVLADNRTPIEGKTVADFEIAGHVLANNRFAVAAKFADKSMGVYLATIPLKSYKRMGSPAAAIAPVANR